MSFAAKDQNGFHHQVLIIVVAIVTIIGFVGWRVSQHSDARSNSKPAVTGRKTATPARIIDKTGVFKLQSVSVGGCQALIPSGWDQPAVNDTATTFDALSPDKSMYVGYGHQTVNTAIAPYASNYSPPLNDPDFYAQEPATVTMANVRVLFLDLGSNSGISYTSENNQQIGDYQLRSVASKTHKGVVFFHNTGFAGDGVNYTYSLPMYFALASNAAWEANGMSLAKVSASINCSAKLVARSSGPDIGGSSSSGSSSKDENGKDDGYNPQLGTEYVHDPNTGENYLVDPSRDWSSNGPNGGGYYKANGNDYTQLQPGRAG